VTGRHSNQLNYHSVFFKFETVLDFSSTTPFLSDAKVCFRFVIAKVDSNFCVNNSYELLFQGDIFSSLLHLQCSNAFKTENPLGILFLHHLKIANANNFGVAYSNQAFEYWIILHFEDHQGGGMHRDDYDKKLNDLLKPFGVSYDGKSSKIITEEIFEILDEKTEKERVEIATIRAIRNLINHNSTPPALAESTTTVFKLVKELRKYL
tara:strand:- start:1642 stop:2265 length:624 start_codon:yes stop_codon:yes gene_type:complete